MLNPSAIFRVITIVLLASAASFLQLSAQTKPHCTSSCGDLKIPYPFGTSDSSSDCHYNEDGKSAYFTISCDNSSDPPVPYWYSKSSSLTVANISVDDHEMSVMMFVGYDCYSPSGQRTWGSPRASVGSFQLSSRNRFTVVGCDTYAYFIDDRENKLSAGCMSICNGITDLTGVSSCLGVGCCQTSSFPRNMRTFNISLGSVNNYRSVNNFSSCGYAFVAPEGYFNFSTASLNNLSVEMMPTVLDWAVGNHDCEVARQNLTSYMCKENTDCTNATDGAGYRCLCKQGYRGNPYLSGKGGCQDINECETTNNLCKGRCENSPGNYSCSCPKGQEGDPWRDGGCRPTTPIRDIALGEQQLSSH